MPLDHGCWLDQHDGVEGLRPNSVKPHPEEPVCGEEPKPTRTLTPQDGQLMSQSEQLKLQRGAAANAEGEQRSEAERYVIMPTRVWRVRRNL